MIQKPKGTYDVINGKDILYIENVWKLVMEKHNISFFRTPLFESSDLFKRSVGETSDIVSKEMYEFKDKGDRNLTLRPEGTAGIVRSFIENKLYADTLPVKCWYYGPMYRYERPQAGRYREFYQLGVEVFGSKNPLMDVEVISIAIDFYKMLGITDLSLKINSLGDLESRLEYKNDLIKYFNNYKEDLCEDCLNRLEKNPLRILDCKVDSEKGYMKKVPKLEAYLNDSSKEHINKVKEYLDVLDIDYEVDNNLVRGLDYYTHTVFEVVGNVNGTMLTLCAGGRYDLLVEQLGGPSVPGVGFALGLERLLSIIDIKNEDYVDAYIINMSTSNHAIKLCQELRDNNFIIDMDYMNKNIKSNFKYADKINAKFVIIIGDDELNEKIYTVKNNKTKEEYKIPFDYINYFLEENVGEEID